MSGRNLGAEDFIPLIQQEFAVMHPEGGHTVGLLLESVTAIGSPDRQGFSLLFAGDVTALPAFHDIYQVTNPTLGGFLLFLGPVHVGRAGEVRYQALFSRID